MKFLKMFFDIVKFYKKSDQEIILNEKLTLGEYLEKNKLSKPFIDYHIIPMVSAIWSMPPLEASKMPISFFLKFFQNHGLFKLKNRPQWYTVCNRSRTYVNQIISKISGEHYKNYTVSLPACLYMCVGAYVYKDICMSVGVAVIVYVYVYS